MNRPFLHWISSEDFTGFLAKKRYLTARFVKFTLTKGIYGNASSFWYNKGQQQFGSI